MRSLDLNQQSNISLKSSLPVNQTPDASAVRTLPAATIDIAPEAKNKDSCLLHEAATLTVFQCTDTLIHFIYAWDTQEIQTQIEKEKKKNVALTLEYAVYYKLVIASILISA